MSVTLMSRIIFSPDLCEAIASLHERLIIFDGSFKGMEWNITVFAYSRWHWPFDPEMWSHKLNGPGLMYEVAVSIFNGLICWVNGSFKAVYGDKDVLVNEGLAEALEGDWEHIEADTGYRSKDTKVEMLNKQLRHLVVKGMYHT